MGAKSTKKEVKALFEHLQENYPELVKEFKTFMFTAFKERPVIPNKQHEYFRVLMDIEKEK